MTLLSRGTLAGAPAPAPARLAHLGLGAFHRSHQAWYTHAAADAGAWGIEAFTGRRPDLAEVLGAQDGLYTLVVRGPQADAAEVVTAVAGARDGADLDAWTRRLADPGLAVVTLTVTEAGYHLDPGGSLALEDAEVASDVGQLRTPGGRPRTAPGRLVAGVAARRRADAGPLAVVPCDNLTGNGTACRSALLRLADAVDPGLAEWTAATVSFVSTVVDRITPAAGPTDRAWVLRTVGLEDRCPVVAEPFSEWVLAGAFPAGRPAWETAGARFVDDVGPYERRKLRLLNGAHSLLAYAGSAWGHRSIPEAVDDERCRRWLELWWDEASPTVGLPETELADYRATLLERFANRRLDDELARIACDGSLKLSQRVTPVVREVRRAGLPSAGANVLGAWLAHLRGVGAPVHDPAAEQLVPLSRGPRRDAARAIFEQIAPDLAGDAELCDAVADACRAVGG